MCNGNDNLTLKIFVLAFLSLVICGCGPGPGYTNVNGDWCYTFLGGIGDKPVQKSLQAESDSFQVYSQTGYAKDARRVFYEGCEIPNAHAATFSVDDENYARDRAHVFLQGVVVQKADPATFVALEFPYGKDKNWAFCGTLPFEVENLDTFIVTVSAGIIIRSIPGHKLSGPLDNYHEELDPSIDLIYGTQCRAETKNQKFQGPIRVE